MQNYVKRKPTSSFLFRAGITKLILQNLGLKIFNRVVCFVVNSFLADKYDTSKVDFVAETHWSVDSISLIPASTEMETFKQKKNCVYKNRKN